MNYKIEKQTCFYHGWREASNICEKCGVHICQEDSVKVLVTKLEDEGMSFFHKTYCLICHIEYKEKHKSEYTKGRLLFKFLFGLPFMIAGFACLYISMHYIDVGIEKQYSLTYYLKLSLFIVFPFLIGIAFIVIPGYLLYYIELEARNGVYRKTRPLTYEDELVRQILKEKNLLFLLHDEIP